MTIDIQKLFEELNQGDSFKKFRTDNAPISVFYGLRAEAMPSMAILTQNAPIIMESTKYLKVSQWEEKEHVYWSSFDLQLYNARTIFYALCLDMLRAVENTPDEMQAMVAIKNRYAIWRKMFRKASAPMSIEEYQGLFGELYFLRYQLLGKYGSKDAVNAWSGAMKTAKDFSHGNDWYEVKTVSTNSTEVKISSLTQLDSDQIGDLVIVRVEKMSDEYDDGKATVDELINSIMSEIDDEETREMFMSKVIAYGYLPEDESYKYPRFKAHPINHYEVNDEFPRIKVDDISHPEITKISYAISIPTIEKFRRDIDA